MHGLKYRKMRKEFRTLNLSSSPMEVAIGTYSFSKIVIVGFRWELAFKKGL